MYTSNEILKKVNEALGALPYNRKPASLYEPISYVLSLGGKRIRPVLMLLGYQLFSGLQITVLYRVFYALNLSIHLVWGRGLTRLYPKHYYQ